MPRNAARETVSFKADILFVGFDFLLVFWNFDSSKISFAKFNLAGFVCGQIYKNLSIFFLIQNNGKMPEQFG